VYENLLSRDDAFDTFDNVFGDRFPIDPGFGIVAYRLAGMAPNTQLAEHDFNFVRYFLVFGG
jgi:hypothetical protein